MPTPGKKPAKKSKPASPANTKNTKSSKAARPAAKKKTAARATVNSAKAKSPAAKTNLRGRSEGTARERLKVIRPSGQKEDNFFELVHEVARQIPRGRVTSYGAIAAALGTRLSARMVGWAMNACHLSPKPVPAHRVVNSQGLLTGRHHFNPPEKMEQLLEKEGVKVKDNKVVDYKTRFWNPSEEL